MSYLRDQVIILKKIPYREYDRQYILYGRAHGLLMAVARGTLKIQAKQSGSLEPFSRADVMIAKGKAFDHLAVAMPVAPHFELSKLGAFAAAGAFADLCLKLIQPGIADERIYKLWEDYLECLSSLPQDLTALRSQLIFATASLKFMDILGYGPTLGSCTSCRSVASLADAVYWAQGNGLICYNCRTALDSAQNFMRLPENSLNLLKLMRLSPFSDLLRISVPVDDLRHSLAIMRQVWSHAPLYREPHGLVTIEKMLG